MILWGIFFTFLTTISTNILRQWFAADHGTYWLADWLFIWPEQKYFVYFYPPQSFFHSLFLCHHCYFIFILPLCYCDYPNGYTYTATLHCIAWLCLWASPTQCACACAMWKKRAITQQQLWQWQVRAGRMWMVCVCVDVFDYKIEMDNAVKSRRQMIWRRIGVSSSTTSFLFVQRTNFLFIFFVLKSQCATLAMTKHISTEKGLRVHIIIITVIIVIITLSFVSVRSKSTFIIFQCRFHWVNVLPSFYVVSSMVFSRQFLLFLIYVHVVRCIVLQFISEMLSIYWFHWWKWKRMLKTNNCWPQNIFGES